jgi:hypothetical protein
MFRVSSDGRQKMTRPFLAGFGEQGYFGLSSAAALSSGESLRL